MSNTTPEVVEGNKLIAIFMGAKYFEHPMKHLGNENEFIFEQYPCSYHSSKQWAEDRLHYHHLWDWLMPVVEKIGEILANTKMAGYIETYAKIESYSELAWGWEVKIWWADILEPIVRVHSKVSLLDAYYNAVIQFSQWYNNQNKPQ